MIEYSYPSPVIAQRIQSVFDENKLTDGYVANLIEVDRKCILHYRNAITNPSIKFVRWICSTYKIDANWLLDLK